MFSAIQNLYYNIRDRRLSIPKLFTCFGSDHYFVSGLLCCMHNVVLQAYT